LLARNAVHLFTSLARCEHAGESVPAVESGIAITHTVRDSANSRKIGALRRAASGGCVGVHLSSFSCVKSRKCMGKSNGDWAGQVVMIVEVQKEILGKLCRWDRNVLGELEKRIAK
jgi:hypothetical protein